MTTGHSPETDASTPLLDDDAAGASSCAPVDVFPVVGIGASAGGLEAFLALLEHLPADTGMAFVLIQHLDPKHESSLVELLAKVTEMPVQLATEGLKVAPDNVYVIPPNTNMRLAERCLRLTPRNEARGQHLPIDYFFRSLSSDKQSRSVGVVLSGTGSDGSLGLSEIKAAGGLTFAQDQESAKYDGMPKSAAHTGAVDLVLTPEEIARELARIGRHPYLGPEDSQEPEPSRSDGGEDEDLIRKILHLLRSSCGVDFSLYRKTTIRRRIMRRLVLHPEDTLADYARKLEGNRAELEALFEDLLINVTSFFRDPEMFRELAESVFPAIVQAKSAGQAIRIWTAGCSTGQEAYSIAMALSEFLDDKPDTPEIQVFATDLSDAVSLAKARAGHYPDSIEGEVSPERLRRFFRKENGGYRVVKAIRDLCVFAKQNIAQDPPFSRMDLISCRNVLIYLSPPLQKRIIPTFHYALNPGGFLLLGASETVGGFSELFEAVDKTHKIYARKATTQRVYPHFSADRQTPRAPANDDAVQPPPTLTEWQKEADRLLVSQYAPVGVLVNDRLEVMQFRGRTSPYLEPAPGDASFNLLKMAREGLFAELRSGIAEAREKNAAVERAGVGVRDNGHTRLIDLKIVPLHLRGTTPASFLVLFEEPRPPDARERRANDRRGGAQTSRTAWSMGTAFRRNLGKLLPGAAGREGKSAAGALPRDDAAQPEQRELEQLRRELAATREHQQSILEQQEAANEELRSANEEVLSSNEELQSTNEELETAKEELQSLNEELTTVNEQLQSRNLELNRLNNDLGNFFGSTKIALVMLGNDLKLRRFTPAAEKAFNLHEADVGRPLGDIRLSVDVPDLEALVLETQETMQLREQEVQDREGRWHLLRVRPYRTAENTIEGAVVALIDIDEIKRSEQRLKEAADYAEAIVATVRVPLLVLNAELRVQTANGSFYRTYQVKAEETENRPLYELGDGQWDIPDLRSLLDEILARGRTVENYEVEHDFPSIGPRTMLLNARALQRKEGGSDLILLALEDVTERNFSEKAKADLAAIVESSDDAIVSKDLDGVIRSWNRGAERIFGYSQEEIIGQSIMRIVPPDLQHEEKQILESLRRGNGVDHYETVRLTKDGQRLDVSLTISPVNDSSGKVIGASKIARDIRDVKRTAQALKDANRRKDEFLAMLAHELRNPLSAISSAVELLGTPDGADHLDVARLIIGRQTVHLARLVDDLLDMSRITRGVVALRKDVLNVNTLIEGAVEQVKPLIEQRRHVLEVSVPRKPLWLEGDETRLEQLLANLLTNSAKYTEPGGRIEIKARRLIDTIIITVRDNGIGISAELLPDVFELFSQSDRSADRSAGGLGIGLTLVKSIAEMHGGSVEAKSGGLRNGSEFTVRLPGLAVADKRKEVQTRSVAVANPGPARRILVVDDNEDAALALSRLLEASGHTVFQAYDGPSSLEAATNHEPDVVLLDIGLPGLDGYEVAKRMRQDPALSEVLLVALSGYCQEEDRERSREAGFDHHLAKPTDHKELLALLAAAR